MITDCPTCWGNRIILEPAGNGEGLVPVTCETCLGTGAQITLSNQKETIQC